VIEGRSGASGRTPHEAAGTAGQPVRVLVVEDFAQLREMLTDGLLRAGFAVESAGSVQHALALQPERFDALVVDQRLDGALGTDMFHTLYDQDAAIASRFILMTADERAVDLPAGVPILLKPFRITVLVDALRQLVDRADTPR
jgi:DNA-binding response OmpR family regulator